MPDKYSYRPNKKKKTVRRLTVDQPVQNATEPMAAATAETSIQPSTASKPAMPVRPAAAARPTVSSGESRSISRVTNLGAELRRLAVITTLILIVLVTASIVLK
jgi:hypothetical protein